MTLVQRVFPVDPLFQTGPAPDMFLVTIWAGEGKTYHGLAQTSWLTLHPEDASENPTPHLSLGSPDEDGYRWTFDPTDSPEELLDQLDEEMRGATILTSYTRAQCILNFAEVIHDFREVISQR